jgi:maltooligosyltrehalose trehalohydrolase
MKSSNWKLRLGAWPTDNKTVQFKVWAPRYNDVSLVLVDDSGNRELPMTSDERGYWTLETDQAATGDRYFYKLDNDYEFPDPVSRWLPDSIHGPTEIVDPEQYSWLDQDWKGITLDELIFYELHIGTFTSEGTFDAAVEKIPYLLDLGITCIEIMPVAQFPGSYNWGYDGASPFAVQNSYGGPDGLKRLVDACHQAGIAVCLDVIYNHMGPEGNYLHAFGHYFTNRYNTPWGPALNFDGPYSDEVRSFFISNAKYWIEEYHIDILRFDAIHAIYDMGVRHILSEIIAGIQEIAGLQQRTIITIAESDRNDVAVITPEKNGGMGMDGQWADEFHHGIHVTVTGEKEGYYGDYTHFSHLAKAARQAFVYDGIYSNNRKRRVGNSPLGHKPRQFVTCIQNHDQVGNRAFGDRLSTLAPETAVRASSVLFMLLPYTPLIFMGQEYGETAPFQFFVDHSDEHIRESVRKGRFEEFKAFGWDKVADPVDKATFLASKLKWEHLQQEIHKSMLSLYRDLISLRRRYITAKTREFNDISVEIPAGDGTLIVTLDIDDSKRLLTIINLQDCPADIPAPGKGTYRLLLDSSSGLHEDTSETMQPSLPEGILSMEPWSAAVYLLEE